MRQMAEGKLDTHIATQGRDEISEMAVALQTFRDTLAETQAELIQAGKLAALGQLAAGVAHELNQPLAAIRSYAHNTNRLIEKNEMDEARATLNRISGLVERMGGTVNHLRNLARRSSNTLETVDLGKTCDDALQLLEGRIRDSGIAVVSNLNHEIWKVRADAIRLEQVIINLVGNAIDAMIGTNDPQLLVSAEESDSKISLIIQDSGTGIASDDLGHIFDPFFTTKSPGDGVGLGLAISFNIVKDFGGSMRASSEPDGFTTFRVTLNKAEQYDG